MTALQPVLIAGHWDAASDVVGQFTRVNPSTRCSLPELFPVSGPADVERAMCAALAAQRALVGAAPEQLADFLEAYAAGVQAQASELVELAALETALPVAPRLLQVELPRTLEQLRQAAAAARERTWRRAVIDTRAKLRSHYESLAGPVLVFGPNNFPFAFNGVSGGDFAAAIATGNAVIAKAHPSHPMTTQRLAQLALHALERTGLPKETVQLLYHVPAELGLSWVADARLGATAFTGSRAAGLKLKAAADRAGRPIWLELSSVNPIFILPGALSERLAAIAAELAASCCLGAGQFCTNPGMSVVSGPLSEAWVQALRAELEARSPGTLLGPGGVEQLSQATAVWQAHGAERLLGGNPVASEGYQFQHSLYRVAAKQLLAHAAELQTEAFGAVHLVVVADDEREVLQVAAALEGNLTGTIYSHTGGADDVDYEQLAPVLRGKVGRLLNDKMPTGVALSPAMHHGGPYPATGNAAFTAVGAPGTLPRFAALRAYDNVRPERLPPELRDKNPTGKMWRSIDGNWTQADVA